MTKQDGGWLWAGSYCKEGKKQTRYMCEFGKIPAICGHGWNCKHAELHKGDELGHHISSMGKWN